MSVNKPHLFLANPKDLTTGFKKTRDVSKKKKTGGTEGEEREQELPSTPNASHQASLREAYISFVAEKRSRDQKRVIDVPATIDLLTIHFYKRFDQSLQELFLQRYGLSVISYENFNKSVLFSIVDDKLFNGFTKHIQQFYESATNIPWQGTPYNLIALVHKLEFHTTKKIVQSSSEQQTLFSLIDIYDSKSRNIFAALTSYLKKSNKPFRYSPQGGILEVSGLSKAETSDIVSSFDIFRHVSSSRVERLKPSEYGTAIRDFGFSTLPDSKNIKVGVIDTGVTKIDPLKPVTPGESIDLTDTTAFWDDHGHGTLVAGIVAVGSDFYDTLKSEYLSNADIVPIKVLNSGSDDLSIIGIVDAIKKAHDQFGVRIFNMSLNDPAAKKYNSMFSDYAFLLDKLAYENDLLIFISAGNLNPNHIKELLEDPHASHEYPHHFYSPNSDSSFHRCELTNIATPADSLNNITVGALAGNFENRAEFGVTPAKEYPAIYSRKFHNDYNQTIHGVPFMRSQKNKYLNKPDLVFWGGDLFDFEAGIEILRSPMHPIEKYYSRTCGTSLATPLVTSMAAKILKEYPKLKTQSVKALLINSTVTPWGGNPTHFRDAALKGVLRKLVGFGMPDEKAAVFSNENKITFIVEDEIKLEEFKVIPIKLPNYINDSENKINITATLCYSFLPVKNNHISYCPLQITFGFFKNMAASAIANSNLVEHQLKSNVSWSDDFFGVENRVFCNTQKIGFSLSGGQIKDLGNELAVAIKCTGKNEIETVNVSNLRNIEHKFSLAISVSELPYNRASGNLYNEMTAINTIENITTANLEAKGDLEAEIE